MSRTSELLSLGRTWGNLTRGKSGAKSSFNSLSQTSRRLGSRRRVNVDTVLTAVGSENKKTKFRKNILFIFTDNKQSLGLLT